MADEKSKSKSSSATEEEISTFVPEKTKITTIYSEEVIVPKISWKKEIQLIKLIELVLGGVGETFAVNEDNTVALISKIMEVAPDKATRFVGIVLDKDDEWVENNLDMPVIISVIVPLLRQRLEMVMEKMQPYLVENETPMTDALQKTMPTLETIQ